MEATVRPASTYALVLGSSNPIRKDVPVESADAGRPTRPPPLTSSSRWCSTAWLSQVLHARLRTGRATPPRVQSASPTSLRRQRANVTTRAPGVTQVVLIQHDDEVSCVLAQHGRDGGLRWATSVPEW